MAHSSWVWGVNATEGFVSNESGLLFQHGTFHILQEGVSLNLHLSEGRNDRRERQTGLNSHLYNSIIILYQQVLVTPMKAHCPLLKDPSFNNVH